jgi:hypothetical protein
MRSITDEEKREPASDTYTAIVDGLKALDPNRPIREADIDRLELLFRKMTFEPSFAGRRAIREAVA